MSNNFEPMTSKFKFLMFLKCNFQANNCVEVKEWIDKLTKVCQYNAHRLKQYHPGAYIYSHWLW